MGRKFITFLILCLMGLNVSLLAGTGGQITVSFKASDDCTGSMDDQIFEPDIPQQISKNKFSKTGYTFAGWAKSEGGEKVYDDMQTVSFADSDTINLYACWTPNRYTVRFERNLISLGGDMDDQKFTYDKSERLNKNKYTSLFYKFSTWNTDKDGKGKAFSDEAEVKNLTDTPDGVVVLYAQWSFSDFKIKFNANGGQGTDIPDMDIYGPDDKLPTLEETTYTRTGYVFNGWNTKSDGTGIALQAGGKAVDAYEGNDTVILYAQWRPISYTVHYDANVPDGTDAGEMESQEMIWDKADYLKNCTFKYRGHNFVYWSGNKIPVGTEDDKGFDIKEPVVNILNAWNIGNPKDGESVTLYAQWESINYFISFNANAEDATGEMPLLGFTYDEVKQLTKNAFERPGYVFSHWSTDPIKQENVFEDCHEIKNLTDQMDSICILYACWTPIEYKVFFDANRGDAVGEGEMQPQDFVYSVPQALSVNKFTRKGYTFIGWNSEEDGTGRNFSDGQQVDSLVTVKGENITLFAQWAPNNYTVEFDRNNVRATGEMQPQKFVYDTPQALEKCVFEHPDSLFIGWTNKAKETIYTDGMTVENLTDEADGIVKFYALWGEKEYFVHFDANGGNGEMDNQRLAYNVEKQLIANEFTRTGYSFEGWSLTPGGNVDFKDEELVQNLTSNHGEIINLYAVWREHSYVILFNGNNGLGSMKSLRLRYSERKVLPFNTFKLTGYIFTGWNTDYLGNGEFFEDGQEVQKLSEDDNANIFLYAQWTPIRYTLVFKSNGGEGEMDDRKEVYNNQSVLPANEFTRRGHTFLGWAFNPEAMEPDFKDESKIVNLTAVSDTTLILYALWKEHSYTVRFNHGDGEQILGTMNPQVFDYEDTQTLRSVSFVWTGHSFVKWNTELDGSGTDFYNEQKVSKLTEEDGAVIDLYAQWKANRYTVAFNANGGEGSMDSMEFDYDGEIGYLIPNVFVRTGYTYMGWNTMANGKGVSYADRAEVKNWTSMPSAVITLYAQWKPNEYTLCYDANGGDGEMPEQTVAYDEKASLKPNVFVRAGHTFLGWNTAVDGSGISYEEGTEVFNWRDTDGERITLYAQWRAHKYTVIYAPNGGSGKMERQNFTYDEEQALHENKFTRTGYSFAGWNISEQGNGEHYADRQVVNNLTEEDGAFVGLYAQWTPLQYNVTFVNADGTELQSGLWDYGTMPKYTGETPEKEMDAEFEYEFAGWSPEIVPVTGETVYTAQFRSVRRTYTVTFMSEGEILQQDKMWYGDMPYFRAEVPVKSAENGKEYRFAGWSPELGKVVGDAVYTAVFEEMPNTGLDAVESSEMTVRTEGLRILVEGLDENEEIIILDISSCRIYRGTGRDIMMPAAGLYIVCRNGEAVKVMVK